MFLIILRKTMVCYQATVVNSLKCSADRKAKAAFLTRQEEIWYFLSNTDFRIRIVKINQAKRHVDNRNLNAEFDTDARTKVAETIKRRIVNPDKRVGLRLAAEINLLKSGG